METIAEFKKQLKAKHKGNFLTLWKIFKLKQRLRKSVQLWVSLILAILISTIVVLTNNDTLSFLDSLTSRILNIMPNILGFNLAGYILLISVNSEDLLKELASNDDEGYSFFQHASSIYAWSVIIQACTLFIAFVISIFIDLKMTCHFQIVINSITILIISFFSFYSLLLIIRLILNVFGFSQTIHFFTKIKSITKQK